MRLIGTVGATAALIVATLLNLACADEAQLQALPRSFGPTMLGMTIEDFTKAIKIVPQACPLCADNEVMADLYIDDYPGIFPRTEKPRNPNAAQFNFYNGKLYKIDLPRESSEIDETKKKFIKKFGPITRVEEWKNGVSWLVWENERTALAIAYIREKDDRSGSDSSETVGTVTGIQYLDKTLRDALAAQEKGKPAH